MKTKYLAVLDSASGTVYIRPLKENEKPEETVPEEYGANCEWMECDRFEIMFER